MNFMNIMLKTSQETIWTIQGADGRTALHLAAISGNVEIIRHLLAKSNEQDRKIMDNAGRTVFHYAAMHLPIEICAEIVRIGSKPIEELQQIADFYGWIAMDYAGRRAREQMKINDGSSELSGGMNSRTSSTSMGTTIVTTTLSPPSTLMRIGTNKIETPNEQRTLQFPVAVSTISQEDEGEGGGNRGQHDLSKKDGFNYTDTPVCCFFLKPVCTKDATKCGWKHMAHQGKWVHHCQQEKECRSRKNVKSGMTYDAHYDTGQPCIYGKYCRMGHAPRVANLKPLESAQRSH